MKGSLNMLKYCSIILGLLLLVSCARTPQDSEKYLTPDGKGVVAVDFKADGFTAQVFSESDHNWAAFHPGGVVAFCRNVRPGSEDCFTYPTDWGAIYVRPDTGKSVVESARAFAAELSTTRRAGDKPVIAATEIRTSSIAPGGVVVEYADENGTSFVDVAVVRTATTDVYAWILWRNSQAGVGDRFVSLVKSISVRPRR
jgi:hypothetical protein